MEELEHYLVPKVTPINQLLVKAAFDGLDELEKLYAFWVSKASWEGAKVCPIQTSMESGPIISLLLRFFGSSKRPDFSDMKGKDVSDEDFSDLVQYACNVFANMGNYKSFGDTKFIPRISEDVLERIMLKAPIEEGGEEFVADFKKWKRSFFEINEKNRQLGLGEKGISTYYSPDCTEEDAAKAQEYMDAKGISAYNTRLFKRSEDGKYEIRKACATVDTLKEDECFIVTRGDYSPVMRRLSEACQAAAACATNETQRRMWELYAEHFMHGDIEVHKDAQREWIRDIGPVVESNIGFIESYRDPFGQRGEFEGWCAVVNKKTSEKFQSLVANAEEYLCLLPWPKEFEKDRFLKPDFTSLEVLSFATSGVPAGINVPNYDDIRQSEGFKNVSLGNVIASSVASKDPVSFLTEEDQEKFRSKFAETFELQVGLHELLGHGSGKLFVRKRDGEFNFDVDRVRNPLTGELIQSWYKESESYDSRFKTIASAMEECRAECVGIYLSTEKDILRVFGFSEEEDAANATFLNWLIMARSGLLALEFYTPATKSWRQAHMWARFAILNVMLEASKEDKGLSMEKKCAERSEKLEDIILHMCSASGIEDVLKPAIGNFLLKIMTFKATGDYAAAKELFDKYTTVSDEFLSIRELVLEKKKPRRMV
eukprot:TRINITY_DN319_c0_g1_i2.p1 TRINITY_DN319_c0_g1~~TRINITY_DN319_c0_g1_i2.p1  ORF type:complete len:704 (-),score=188.52 TRINITY_DN319_c0_g1_i2:1054-3021(-)